MNYISEINAFENWCEINPLPTAAQLLWYKLMALNNKAGWVEWFAATNPYLMVKLGISDEKTLIAHRNRLKTAGLIDFKPGKKGQPTKYKFMFFTGEIPVYNPVKTPVYNPVEKPVKTPDIIDIDKDIDLKENNKRKKQVKPIKNSYAEFVELSEDEYNKLLESYGQAGVNELISMLDNYKGSSGRTYKSDYRAILTWPVKELEKNKKAIPGTNNNAYKILE